MEKITHDKLADLGPVIKGAFELMYPTGLTMEQLEEKAQKHNWLRIVYDHVKEAE